MTKMPATHRVTIELSYPITIDGTEVRSLSIRRPKVSDILYISQSPKSDTEKEVELLSNLCEITQDNMGDLDITDYVKLQEQYINFTDTASVKANS